jgi:hypothetical protein
MPVPPEEGPQPLGEYLRYTFCYTCCYSFILNVM